MPRRNRANCSSALLRSSHRTRVTIPIAEQRTRPAIADIMVDFAGAASFAADINFFDAAGTSICAMRVVMAITRNWGVGIPLDAFVATPTAADLARAVTGGIRQILSP